MNQIPPILTQQRSELMRGEHQVDELAGQCVRVRGLVRACQYCRTYSGETAFPAYSVDFSSQQRGAVRGGYHQAHHCQGFGLQRMFEDALAHVPQAAFEWERWSRCGGHQQGGYVASHYSFEQRFFVGVARIEGGFAG
ncbi:hypothetical protein ALP74_200353 [Pseudomonas coronafaciens pv. garcae]|uniref:Uncharacterized protein n=1 Tax=Pseudomonas coronafaciens pv. garcae TaxID=251653 RepID=A0AB37QH05_9PSED|nr:hypothetical protein ALP74_200353 [Pseudomonas coronafaciens pv. garcae]